MRHWRRHTKANACFTSLIVLSGYKTTIRVQPWTITNKKTIIYWPKVALASWLFQHHTWTFCRHKILRRHCLRTPLFHCKLTFRKYKSAFLYTVWQKRRTAASQTILVQFSADKEASCHYMQCYFRTSLILFENQNRNKCVSGWRKPWMKQL